MLDSRTTFIKVWNRLNARWNELVEIFTLSKEEYEESQVTLIKINELLRDDAYYFGFENLKLGDLI